MACIRNIRERDDGAGGANARLRRRLQRRGQGQYLFDRSATATLTSLSGWGVFLVGRIPFTTRNIEQCLSAICPISCRWTYPVCSPNACLVLFRFSTSKALQIFPGRRPSRPRSARRATRRPGIIYCDHAFHGWTYGALSLNGDGIFRRVSIPSSLAAPLFHSTILRFWKALSARDAAAFIVEPIQGKGSQIFRTIFTSCGAQALCRKYGPCSVADEIQTGLGRTGRFSAQLNMGVEPDLVLLAKTRSPVVMCRSACSGAKHPQGNL